MFPPLQYEVHEINLTDFDHVPNGDAQSSELGATADPTPSANGATAAADEAVAAALGAVALDEQLFVVDDDELDAMDDELDTLTIH